ncbi:hypothetical protein GCM10027343_27710 [Noviherbaspirillum agri]
MNSRADLLEWKRQQLLAECDAQRMELAVQLDSLNYQVETIQTGLRIMDRVRRHPGWIATAVVALFAITPRRLSAAIQSGTSLLRAWRMAAPALRMLMQRH